MESTIIIATCGRPQRLLRTIKACAHAIAVSQVRHRILVVDNSDDRSAQAALRSSEYPVTCILSEPRNKCSALNAGIAAADTEWLAFTDDDTEPAPDWLVQAARFADQVKCRFFGGRIVAGPISKPLPRWMKPGRSGRVPGGSVFVTYEPLSQSGLLPVTAPVPYGANAFARRDLFTDHGAYDEELWRICGRAALGVDDGELGVRLQSRGEPIGYCHEAVVVHPVHEDRYGVGSHLRINYRYGWRDPIVFYAEDRPVLEPFRIGQIARKTGQFCVDMLVRDPAGAVEDLTMIARHTGAVFGRISSRYRRRVRLQKQRTEGK